VSARTGVIAAGGFRANGVACGIKAGGALDLALVTAEAPVPAAAVFTRSLTAAPSVLLSRDRIRAGSARAVVLNSGCANAGTGESGLSASERMASSAAAAIGAPAGEVLVCSTGPIGPVLPVERIEAAMAGLVSGLGDEQERGLAAATAIMTTDSVPKQAVAPADGYVVGGMAKGAGMIRPDMATMLSVLTTDAVVDAETLRAVLGAAVSSTFNCLNVDGCQSTNDTVILLASGSSGVQPDTAAFAERVEAVCRDLARAMAADAEGASKVVTIRVAGAATIPDARRLGMTAADSALVRSSFYGADPNWGRVFGALGVAGVALDPSAVSIAYEGVEVCRGGVGVPVDEDALSARLAGDFVVDVVVGDGPGSAEIVTTDLTPDYVRFNGERS
jgi:glutamate N-acetyltransferase/amino-acid N-acetyltransferase